MRPGNDAAMKGLLASAFLAGAAITLIVYGSLFPFCFDPPSFGSGPVRTLLESWALPFQGADFLRNIVFYVPLGFSLSAVLYGYALKRRLVVALLIGAGFSLALELLQYYTGRTCSAHDVVANITGTIMGAAVAATWQGRARQ